MAFTRVNPLSWGTGSKLTSAQANQLDTNVSLALDKSVAGDTISGTVSLAATGEINVATPGGSIQAATTNAINATVNSGIVSTAAGGISSNTSGGIAATTASGIVPSVANGINAGGVVGGIQGGVAGGIKPGIAKGIKAGIADGIDIDVAGGLQTSVVGGFVLGGGVTDWPIFTSTRSRTNTSRPMRPIAGLQPGWTASYPVPGVVGPATSQSQFCAIESLHDGATLFALSIIFAVGNSHAGGAPGTFPQFAILRYSLAVGASLGLPVYLSTSNLQAPTAGSGAAWYASGNVQVFNYSCNQNNVIDCTNYIYELQIIDETGSNSAAGNIYMATNPNYSGIANMAFP